MRQALFPHGINQDMVPHPMEIFMTRIFALLFLLIGLLGYGPAQAQEPQNPPAQGQTQNPDETFSNEQIGTAVSDYFGVSSEAAGSVVERVFADQGRPVGYIYGEEGSVAFAVGLRYGTGIMVLKDGTRKKVYWQGPSVGFDVGGNGAKVFTLVYGLHDPEDIYHRFPGVEGSAYLVAGIGVNYQRAKNITLAPMRTGVGLRLGANVGYLKYSRKRKILPF